MMELGGAVGFVAWLSVSCLVAWAVDRIKKGRA